MEKKDVRELAIDLAKQNTKAIIATIPTGVGIYGDLIAMQFLRVAKEHCSKEKFPMGVFDDDHYFAFANADRLLSDEDYLEMFVEKATNLNEVEDVVIFF